MKTFKESGLIFSFPDHWQVTKWDEHRFYGYVSGAGFKGVDFMAIADQQLYLIEVKNYARRPQTKGPEPILAPLDQPEIYAQKYIHKFEDSFALIRIIRKYYLRKTWFRWWARLNFWGLNWFSNASLTHKYDVFFWTKAAKLIQSSKANVRLIVWLETGPVVSEVGDQQFRMLLHQHFAAYCQQCDWDKIELMQISTNMSKINVKKIEY